MNDWLIFSNGKKLFFNSVLIMVLSLFASNRAEAYIDPGSGSIALQVLIASLIGLFFKLREFFSRWLKKFKKLVFGD